MPHPLAAVELPGDGMMSRSDSIRKDHVPTSAPKSVLLSLVAINALLAAVLGTNITLTWWHGLAAVSAGSLGFLIGGKRRLAIEIAAVGGFASAFLWLPIATRPAGVLGVIMSSAIVIGAQARVVAFDAKARRQAGDGAREESGKWSSPYFQLGVAIEVVVLVFLLMLWLR